MRSVSKFFDGGDIIANYELDLEVEDGEFLVFLGPSGCGKTTALRMIAGLETPSDGEIYFDDDRVDDMPPADRNVAMVFQNYALYPHMSVRENIEYPLKVRGVPPEERDERVAEIAELLHIEDQLDSDPASISGGQRQRTSLARAIIREPSVFLLDEPLSNLDAKLRLEMRSELKRLQNELDITTVYVTHNQEEAMSMGDRIAVMNEGTIRQVAEPEELYRRPKTAWVAQFIGSPPMNLLEGTNRDGTIRVDDENSVPAARETTSADVSVGFRPEDAAVTTTEPDTDWRLRGTVKTVEPLGEYVLVNVDVGDTTVNAKVDRTDVESGQQVFLSVDPDDVYLYDGDGELVA
ncbi:ABC transporter ATP-binding protein [Halobacterium sp. CBA1126]|uniref:ABC transporter ATP-binding protein n=1 Tax=Halobacterium TaxID=2239 RepID=UPI0012FA339B|nr:ATP-binding cassette domain-containing protein [Halobacterium sp. CBA1126]